MSACPTFNTSPDARDQVDTGRPMVDSTTPRSHLLRRKIGSERLET